MGHAAISQNRGLLISRPPSSLEKQGGDKCAQSDTRGRGTSLAGRSKLADMTFL